MKRCVLFSANTFKVAEVVIERVSVLVVNVIALGDGSVSIDPYLPMQRPCR
jgi:hypothetical protein